MATVKDLTEKLEAKQDELKGIFDTYKQDDGSFDMSADVLDDVRARNEELNDISKELENAKTLDTTYKANQQAIKERQTAAVNLPLNNGQPKKDNGVIGDQKTIGELFTESKAFEAWRPGMDARAEIDVNLVKAMREQKATMTTSAGFAPENLRTGRIVESAQRRPMVADLIPETSTNQAAVVYMEETTFTNAADTVAEGGTKPESALAFTQRSDALSKIATWLPVTDEQLMDVSQVQSIINNRLTLMLRLTEETQILSGSGVSPDLEGFYNKSGIQTQAKGSDPVPDAIYKAITKVRNTGFADPTGVVLHPNDWQDIRLLRTTDGIYIWGSPAEAGEERVWGLPVVPTTAATENTGLVGDFQMYSELFRKNGITIKTTDSHSDNFVKNIQVILAEERIALAIYRAAAFCTVTGI